MVLPNRFNVSSRLIRAIVSRYGAAAGEINAMKSSIPGCFLDSAVSTSAAVFDIIAAVVSSQS